MARPFPSHTLRQQGRLELQELKSGVHRAFFTPPADATPHYHTNPEEYRRPIFDIDFKNKQLKIYPYQVWTVQPMKSRYNHLHTITLDIDENTELYFSDGEDIDGFLYHVLPEAFTEDYNYGLGFKSNYRSIISMLDGFEIEELYIPLIGETAINLKEKRASINRSDLALLVKNIVNITRRAQSVSLSMKKKTTNDLFMELISKSTVKIDRKAVNAELAKRMGMSTRHLPGGATRKEQKDAMEVIRNNSKKIVHEHPGELIKLKNDIELVTLEKLISKFEDMLHNQLPEAHWQKLLEENPFILNMAFGIPIIKVQSQAFVGGFRISGAGQKITDFLVKNRITNNAAIIEIKTPATKLINTKEYRSGIFTPSIEITGAVNQVLDQIFVFQRDISTLKVSSKEYNLESYSVQGILIAGLSLRDPNEQKSFELYRGNSKNVQIITFDELLTKLKDLHNFLCPNVIQVANSATRDEPNPSVDDLPF